MFHVNYCDYNRSNPDYDRIDRPQGSGDYLFLYFITPMKIILNGEMVISKENAFLLFPKDSPQIYEAVKTFRNSFVHFSTEDDSFIQKYQIPLNKLVYLNDTELINNILREIYIEYSTRNVYYEEQIDLLISQMFLLFSRQLQTESEDASNHSNLYATFRKARMEILTHIDREWTAESMAALTNMSVSQFYNLYPTFFGRSPKRDLLDTRIARAKYMLRVDRLPVSQVAELSGFRNLSHFSRYFKKECGMTPTEYGKN